MATVPASLKSSGVVPFVTRANQVEKMPRPFPRDPAGYYWVVQQIVTKGLHNSDAESKKYTEDLMDRLEAAKTEHGEQDAITDEVAAKAYLEQFGLEVFDRADNAIRNNKASKQTADTFQAAYTFLEVLNIWPPLEAEIAAKIKYAKYHALRIAKAIKSGEDPNLSNPPQDSAIETKSPALDPADPEVAALGGLGGQPSNQPSVEEAANENDRNSSNAAPDSSLDQSLPSRSTSNAALGQGPTIPPSHATPAEQFYQQSGGGDVSPLAPSSHGRANSDGGGYFPRVSQPPSDPSAGPPTAPMHTNTNVHQGDLGSPNMPPPVSPVQPSSPQEYPGRGPFYPPQPPAQPTNYAAPNPMGNQNVPPFQPTQPRVFSQPQPQPQAPPPHAAWSNLRANQPTAPQPPPSANPNANYNTDDEAVAKAQKHARWAISALNFEDVKTAVRELQSALETLGAR